MKIYATVALCGVMALVSGGIWGLSSSWAQDGPPRGRDPLSPARVRFEGPRSLSAEPAAAPASPYRAKVMVVGHPDGMHELRQAAEQLSKAEDDDAKTEAAEKLSELLDDYFEEDMKRREQELADVEARVKRLRELMEKRRAKKDDIIELQKEVLVNEAEGLGFFNGGVPGGQRLPAGHPFGMEHFTVPPPPGGEAGGYRAILKRGQPRPAERGLPPKDDGQRAENG